MTDRRNILKIIPAAALGLVTFAAGAQTLLDVTGDSKTSGVKAFDPKKQRRIPDVPGITHTGKRINFYEDLIKDKVVLINFMAIGNEVNYPVTQRLAKVAKKPCQNQTIMLFYI